MNCIEVKQQISELYSMDAEKRIVDFSQDAGNFLLLRGIKNLTTVIDELSARQDLFEMFLETIPVPEFLDEESESDV